MRDLVETTLSIILAFVIIAATYSLLGTWLSSLVESGFDNARIYTQQ